MEFLGLKYIHPILIEPLFSENFQLSLSQDVVGVTFAGAAWRFLIRLQQRGIVHTDGIDARIKAHYNRYRRLPFEIRCAQTHEAVAKNVYPTSTVTARGAVGASQITVSGGNRVSVVSGTMVEINGFVYEISSADIATDITFGSNQTLHVQPRLQTALSGNRIDFDPMVKVRYNPSGILPVYQTNINGVFAPTLDVVTSQ